MTTAAEGWPQPLEKLTVGDPPEWLQPPLIYMADWFPPHPWTQGPEPEPPLSSAELRALRQLLRERAATSSEQE